MVPGYLLVQVAVVLLIRVLIPKTDKYFPTPQPLRNQSMHFLTARAHRPYKDDWKKFDNSDKLR